MDFRILIASFALIFIAELGDKTQLAALALSSSSRSPWAVFLGTSAALVLGSGLAVLFGELLTRFLPVKVLHITSAILFILMGVILLVNIARRADYGVLEEKAEARRTTAEIEEKNTEDEGLMFRLIVNQAMAFEENMIDYLESLSRELPAEEERETLEQLIAADRHHAHTIQEMGAGKETAANADSTAPPLSNKAIQQIKQSAPEPWAPAFKDYPIDRAQPITLDHPEVHRIVEAAVTAEENIAQFYLALSRIANLQSVSAAFRRLAAEDLNHAHQLHALINQEV